MFDFKFEAPTKSDVFDTVKKWDLLIIGGGPAGLNAALYAKRKGLQCAIISEELGGGLLNTSIVDNYLGFSEIGGDKLAEVFVEHVKSLDVSILKGVRVNKIYHLDPDFEVVISDGKRLKTKTLLVATGGWPRKLEVPGEDKYASKGVTYCATCDAPLFNNKHVIVAGGGNSAAEGVLDLVPYASKITVVHRSNWRADQIILSKLDSVENLTVHLETQILEVLGDEVMTGVRVLDKNTKQESIIKADGLLIEIGTVPNSTLINELVETNQKGEVIVDKNQI